MTHTVRFGAKNDGPKTIEFDKLEDAKNYAAETGGKVASPKPAPAPSKPPTK